MALFQPGDRVEHADMNAKGTVVYDDGDNLQIRWDDGGIGNLSYNRAVWYNAYKLQKLVSPIEAHEKGGAS